MTIQKISEAFVLESRIHTIDCGGNVTNLETNHLTHSHVYLTWKGAKAVRHAFITTVLTSCNRATPIHVIGSDGYSTEELSGYVINYTNGGKLEVEISIERVTLED